MEGIILFGTGYVGKNLYQFLSEYYIPVHCWIDSDISKQGKKLFGRPVYGAEKLKGMQEYVCISAKDVENEIYNCVLSYGVTEDRILSYVDLIIQILDQKLPQLHMKEACISRADNRLIFDCTNGLGLGGVEEWSMSLLEPLKTMGYDAYVLSPFGTYQIPEKIRERAIFIELDRERIFSRHNMEEIYHVLKRYCPCTVISKSIDELVLISCVIKKKTPVALRLVSVIHQGLDTVYKENKDVDQYVDKYIAVSRDIQCGMISLGIAADKVLHMTCPVWCPQSLCRSYSLNEKEPIRIGYAGRLEQPQKRMDLLLKLLDALEKAKCEYCFELAGDGKYAENIRQYIADSHLEAKVKMLGRLDRSSMPVFWVRQDICVNIADHEGRSLSIMEAMANGAVPVVTATSGVQEDICNAVNGFFVSTGDYGAIAEKILYLYDNRYLLKQMGMKAHEVISKKCDMGNHMEFWKGMLSRL